MKKNFLSLFILLIATVLVLVGCHQKSTQQSKQVTTVTAKLTSVPTELYYSGTVNPIQIYNVASPTDGVVKELYFKYGQRVKTGDRLILITSSKLQHDYHAALTDYLKAKENYNNTIINFRGTQELRKAGIISQQEFLSSKEQYDSTVLEFLNAKYTLEQAIEKIPDLSIATEKLTAEDIKTLSKILETQYSNVLITAKNSGITLLPQKGSDETDNSGGGSDSSKNLLVGNQVKEGQALVGIGDLSGIATIVQVSELAINQIKPGQPVIITVEALPNMEFHGTVKTVGAQAQTSLEGQGGVATFPVTVIVPTLTPEQSELIRVGMTTKIQITIQNPPQITVPIAAVYQKNGISFVSILDKTTGKTKEIPVVTGQTTLTDVAIIKGLQAGDTVLIPKSNQ